MAGYLPHINLIPHQIFTNPAASVILPIVLGSGVGISTSPDATKQTYKALRQPPLSPPGYVFGPVWTLLYGLMGYASHRAFTAALSLPPSPPSTTSTSLLSALDVRTLYTVQLGLNLVWQPLFFGLRRPGVALVDIIALVGLNGYITSQFFKLDEVAGWCFVPYVAWISFATYLNFGVGYLNEWDISESTLAVRAVKDKRQ